MTYGPNPWHQTSWDARAAGNFIGGGAGCGLILFAALSPAHGGALAALMLAGLGLTALGLFSVSLELGRPLRAINVLRNPRTSWMAREAWAAAALFPVAAAVALGLPELRWVAAALALVFAHCQAHIPQAARGIPAWRDPLVPAFLLATGMAEGGGLFALTAYFHGALTSALLMLFGALVLVRWIVWHAYRRRLIGEVTHAATAVLDRAGRVLMLAGTVAPLALVAALAFTAFRGDLVLIAVAGAVAAVAGSYTKLLLITRAAFNQGFALPHLPVRGTRS